MASARESKRGNGPDYLYVTSRQRRNTVFILIMLGFQAVPVARELTGARETLWPFLAWGMYRHSSEPPVEVVVYRLLATTQDAARPVGPTDAGFERFAFRRLYQIAIANGDSAAAEDLTRRLRRRWRVPVREIVVEESVYTLSHDGLRQATTLRRFDTESQ